jgi:hypothetical protein
LSYETDGTNNMMRMPGQPEVMQLSRFGKIISIGTGSAGSHRCPPPNNRDFPIDGSYRGTGGVPVSVTPGHCLLLLLALETDVVEAPIQHPTSRSNGLETEEHGSNH